MVSKEKLSAVFTALASAGDRLASLGDFQHSNECFQALSVGDETYENGDFAFAIAKNYFAIGDFENAQKYRAIAERFNPAVYLGKELK